MFWYFLSISAGSFCLLRFLYRYVQWWTSPLWKLPGPPRKTWLVGQFLEIMREPFLQPHLKWLAQAPKDAPMLHYTQLMGKHAILVLDAEIVKQMYFAPQHVSEPRFVKKFPMLVRVVGKGLVTLEGTDWHRHRRLLHPAFNDRFLKLQLEQSVPNKVQTLIACWKRAQGTREIQVAAHMSNLTLDVIGEVAFSHDFHGMDSIERWSLVQQDDNDQQHLPELSDQLISSMNQAFKVSAFRILLYLFHVPFLDRVARRSEIAMNQAVDQVIQRSRKRIVHTATAQEGDKGGEAASVSSSSSSSRYQPKSILDLLLDANQDAGAGEDAAAAAKRRSLLTNEELRDEVKTFIVAGHETTATWSYWALFALCQHPDVQEKVFQNVMEHAAINSNDSDGAPMNLETVEKMTYLDAFLKECLRFYPPVGMMIRFSTKNDTIGGVNIPADTRIVIPIQLLHRSPQYWDQPETFLPERWLSNADCTPPYKHPMAFIPFSAGPRNCIGHRFATMEIKLILAPLIRAFCFQLPASLRDTKFELTSRLTIKAKPELTVLAVPRREKKDE